MKSLRFQITARPIYPNLNWNPSPHTIPRRFFSIPSGIEWIGSTGRSYHFKELLQERPHFGRVWIATSENEKFVLKDIPEAIFSNFNDTIKPQLVENPYFRLPCDDILNQCSLVYRYLDGDLLRIVRKGVSVQVWKQILKASLRGLVELHSRDIVQLDVKPDNIMLDYLQVNEGITVKRVQLTDLENAAHLPNGRCIKGMLPGNENWRSPEGHLRGRLNKPHDIFSFGAVCIYAMLGRLIFGPDADLRKHEAAGALPEMIRLQRQISYFPDRDSFNGLITHVGDNELSMEVLGMLWDDRIADYHPYKPFSTWGDVQDPIFEDLISKMMHLDPARRISAQQALDHDWFRESDID